MGTPAEIPPPRTVAAPPGARRVTPSAPVSLSPSRAADFMRCPLLYRLRVIDRLPEKPSEAATRGTVVHAVLERLFDAPAAERTVDRARAMVAGEWERLRAARPELAALFSAAEGAADPAALAAWLESAERLVDRWFALEDPTRLEPAERELYVETVLESGLTLRGYVDRLDIAPATGDLRVVDYKTGKAPRPEYAEEPLFQMKFYALVLWRLRGSCRGGSSSSIWAVGTCSPTTRRSRTCGPPSASCWPCGRRSARPPPAASGARAAARSADGATTRRSVPNSAGLPRPIR